MCLDDDVIRFVTGNDRKWGIARQQVRELAGVGLWRSRVPVPELQSIDVRAVALHKVAQAAMVVSGPLLAEDDGLEMEGLSGFPGALVKPTLAAVKAAGIVALADVAGDRRCRLVNCLAYRDQDGATIVFQTAIPGTIVDRLTEAHDEPEDELWRVFVPHGHDVPLALLPAGTREALIDRWLSVSVFTEFAAWLRHVRANPAHALPVAHAGHA